MKTFLLLMTTLVIIFAGLFAADPGSPEADAQAALLAGQAYIMAQEYFSEYSGKEIGLMTLTGLGLSVPEGVSLEILNGRAESLSIKVSHAKGGMVFDVDSRGHVKSTPKGLIARLFSRLFHSKDPAPGKTEEPRLIRRYPNSGTAARMAVRNAFNMAEYFFLYNPEGTFSYQDLGSYFTDREDGVIIEILNGRRNYLRIRARHPDSGVIWEVDAKGRLTSPAQTDKEEPPVTVLKPPSKEEIQNAADDEARETAGKVFELSMGYLTEYSPAGGLKLDALKRAYPQYSIHPDVTVEVVDGREKTLSLRVWHKEGSKVFEVDSTGQVTARPLKKNPAESHPGLGPSVREDGLF